MVSVGLFSKSLAEECPECQFVCGSAGVADCATCLCQPSCESIECTSPRECVLIDVPCLTYPCPKQPTCIDMSLLCGTEILRDQDELPLRCNDQSLSCSPGYTCSRAPEDLIGSADFAVCCQNNTAGSEQDNARPADVWESLNIESPSSDDCQACNVDLDMMCATMTCTYHPDARCVQDDCSCEVWFVSARDGQRVNCEKETVIPPWVFDGPPDTIPTEEEIDIEWPSLGGAAPPFDGSVSPTEEDQPLPSPSSPSVDVAIIVVATASVVLVLIAIVAVLLYKAAQKKKNSSTVKSISRQQEEQLKPLNEPVPHIT